MAEDIVSGSPTKYISINVARLKSKDGAPGMARWDLSCNWNSGNPWGHGKVAVGTSVATRRRHSSLRYRPGRNSHVEEGLREIDLDIVWKETMGRERWSHTWHSGSPWRPRKIGVLSIVATRRGRGILGSRPCGDSHVDQGLREIDLDIVGKEARGQSTKT